jgi:hypothetical protein
MKSSSLSLIVVKAADSLGTNSDKKKENAKDISAIANSADGRKFIQLKRGRSPPPHSLARLPS